MARGKKQKCSQTALAVIDLQDALPQARVVYASATGATEVRNMAAYKRLGLWGPGTAFPDVRNFVTQIEAGGVGAMEIVARDMKQTGAYCARALSFEGVEYDRLEHVLSDDQSEVYDDLARAWQVVLQNFNSAMELTGADGKAKGYALSAFWSAHQRFFCTILIAMQMPSVLDDIERRLAAGHCCVLQLTNTNEASQERAIAKMGPEDDLSDIDMTPRDQLLQLVQHCFPTTLYEEYQDESGNTRTRPVRNQNGDVVRSKEAEAMRDVLLAKLATIRVPEGPLEMLLNRFGERQVAEITGRSRRVVRRVENGVERTVLQNRTPSQVRSDIEDFCAGRKLVLVFSEAGGTGASYHAGRQFENQRRRYHYLIQAGWRADSAIQGFGRTHRSDQAHPPYYMLCSTNLKGQKRFTSTIARRLDQLGALTKGQRQTASNGMFKSADNLESSYARDALRQFYHDLYEQRVPGFTIEDFQRETGLGLTDSEGGLKQQLPPITQFLNRILSLTITRQDAVFSMFEVRLEQKVQQAIDAGTLDIGVEVKRADEVVKQHDQVIYTDARTEASTRYVRLLMRNKNAPVTFDELTGRTQATWFKPIQFFAFNRHSKRTYGFAVGMDRTDEGGKIYHTFRQIGPHRSIEGIAANHPIDQEDIKNGENWQILSDLDEARRLWTEHMAMLPEWEEQEMHLLVGALLPIWNLLPTWHTRVYRVRTSEGESLLGREIPEDRIHETLVRFGVEVGEKYPPQKVIRFIKAGTHRITLSNGWFLKPIRSGGQIRTEIIGPQYADFRRMQDDWVVEQISWKWRGFLPTDSTLLESAMQKMMQTYPVTDCVRIA